MAPKGWHQDREQSFNLNAYTLVPDGHTFADAESVMYALAIYKARAPEIKTLEALIERDKKDFETNMPDITIKEVASISIANGKQLRSFTFFPANQGNWERVSFNEDEEFYLIFTVSSRSLAGFNYTVSVYEKLVTDYYKVDN